MILETKLHAPPSAPYVLKRPHLTKKLLRGLNNHGRLTLVTAPAGYGKTTLVVSWLAELLQTEPSRAPHVCWLSLDERDNNVDSFLRYLCATLRRATEEVPAYLLSDEPPATDTLLVELINGLARANRPILLILEDYHVINQPEIDTALTFLLDNLPTHCHMVIVSRIDPDLPLAKLRMRRQLTEIRATDLQFSTNEIADFFQTAYDTVLTDDQITHVRNSTEGWIASLQLIGLSLQNHADRDQFLAHFSGSNRFIMDYLTDEVLGNLSEELQRVLLFTSILGRFSVELCDHLLAGLLASQTGSQATIAELIRRQLFVIPLDETGVWYRYHHLFADLLHQRLLTQYPAQEALLHQRACAWFSQAGLWDEAAQHALKSAEINTIVTTLRDYMASLFELGRSKPILAWLTRARLRLSAENRSYLRVWQNWLYVLAGEMENVQHAVLPPDNQWDNRTLALHSGLQGIIAANNRDPATALAAYQHALSLLNEQSSIIWHSLVVLKGRVQIELNAVADALPSLLLIFDDGAPIWNLVLMGLYTRTGLDAHQNWLIIKQFFDQFPNAPPLAVGWLNYYLGHDLYFRNQLDEALAKIEVGVKLVETTHARLWLNYQRVYVQLLLALGRPQEALDQAVICYQRFAMKTPAAMLILCLLSEENFDEVDALLHKHNYSVNDVVEAGHYFSVRTFAHYLMCRGRFDDAHRVLQQCIRVERMMGNRELIAMVNVQLAGCFLKLGRRDEAQALLAEALDLAASRNYLRSFIDCHPAYVPLLREMVVEAPAFIGRILAITEQDDSANANLAEPLSSRELEILQLIAAGHNNRQIAEQLFLAVGTIKRHAANIYGKLDVNSRTAATAVARDLGLLG